MIDRRKFLHIGSSASLGILLPGSVAWRRERLPNLTTSNGTQRIWSFPLRSLRAIYARELWFRLGCQWLPIWSDRVESRSHCNAVVRIPRIKVLSLALANQACGSSLSKTGPPAAVDNEYSYLRMPLSPS